MSVLFLTFGPTHSGKTTFGKKLQATLGKSAKFIHVDNDLVDEFIKENYGNLRADKAILATRSPTNPDLRLLIPQLIAEYALKEDFSVIATAAHPKQVIRQSYYDIARRSGAKVVLVAFRIDEDLALRRIDKADRKPNLLSTSPHGVGSFRDLFYRQQHVLEEPTEAEKQACFRVLEVYPDNVEDMVRAAAELV